MAARRACLAALVLGLALLAGGEAHAGGPALVAPPSITGTASAGSRLVASSGTWTTVAPVTYGYQWHRCNATGAKCTSVHGATGAGYTLTGKDVGGTLGVTVTAAAGGGSNVAYTSLVGPITTSQPLLVSTAQPQVTGLPIQGKTLQVTTGAWSPAPASLAYAWQRCNANGRLCAPIGGASASSYTVSAPDVGHALVALVLASFGTTHQGALSSATAAAIGADVAGPTHTALPAVAGVARAGVQLTGSTGEWTGIGPLVYAFQWYRCDDAGAHCSSIHGATKATYRTVPADAGKTLGFTVRATDSTGTAAAYANLFGPVAQARSAVASSARPSLAGTARPGGVLTATAGEWQPSTGSAAYTWRRCNANGRLCVPIAGATAASYTVTGFDVGHTLAAVVSTTVDATTQSAYSAASPLVT